MPSKEAVASEATAAEVDELAQPSESMASVSHEEGAAAVPMEDTDVPIEQQERPSWLTRSFSDVENGMVPVQNSDSIVNSQTP